MTIWYKTERYEDVEIKEVDILKSTSARVWLAKPGSQGHSKQTWEGIHTDFHRYFETKAKAVAHLRKRQEERIQGAKWEINDGQKKLEKLKRLYGDSQP